MSDKIRMTHPDLPGQEINVRPVSAKVHGLAGWVETPLDEDAAAVGSEPGPEATSDGAPVPVTPTTPPATPVAAALPAGEPAAAKKSTPARAGQTQES